MKAVVFVANRGHRQLRVEDGHRFYLDVSAAWPVTQLQPVSNRTFLHLIETGVVSPVTPCPPVEILALALMQPVDQMPPPLEAYGRPYLVR